MHTRPPENLYDKSLPCMDGKLLNNYPYVIAAVTVVCGSGWYMLKHNFVVYDQICYINSPHIH